MSKRSNTKIYAMAMAAFLKDNHQFLKAKSIKKMALAIHGSGAIPETSHYIISKGLERLNMEGTLVSNIVSKPTRSESELLLSEYLALHLIKFQARSSKRTDNQVNIVYRGLLEVSVNTLVSLRNYGYIKILTAGSDQAQIELKNITPPTGFSLEL